MRSWQGMLSAPFEKRRGGTLKLLIDVTLPSIVRVFVYVSTVQAQYPGLNVPARDEMNDLLVITARRQVCPCKCVLELPKAPFHIAAVGVDCHNQRGLSA